ncbi:MAG TPA: hypothetical protein VH268_11865 [Solirubrobacterales bacterium]|nr:hypothetical protein [Solirubrobacterales bacterium]
MTRRLAALIVAGSLTVAGCGGHSEPRPVRGSLNVYLHEVEPIRLGVNRLLEGADPILSAYRAHRITPATAQRRLGRLERRFAAYAVQIAAVAKVPPALRSAQRSYAHTFVLEDAYLSALVAALPEHDFDGLPETQARQRAAIIGWRIQLEVLAERRGVDLPADLEAAGRGEIAPSPGGS